MWLRLGYILSLGALLPLDYFKLYVIALLKALVTFRLDGAVMDKDIGTVVTANKTEAFGVVEPLHFTFNSRHVPYSTGPSDTVDCPYLGPLFDFLEWPLLKGGTHVAGGNKIPPLPHSFLRLIPVIGFFLFSGYLGWLSTCLIERQIGQFAVIHIGSYLISL
jgi:hypothetical protein